MSHVDISSAPSLLDSIGPARLLAPERDVEDPEISIVIPALNEERTVAEFVRWSRGLADAGVSGEILIVDSSTDATAERALEAGARVLRIPQARYRPSPTEKRSPTPAAPMC